MTRRIAPDELDEIRIIAKLLHSKQAKCRTLRLEIALLEHDLEELARRVGLDDREEDDD